jgi:hypothetical protein
MDPTIYALCYRNPAHDVDPLLPERYADLQAAYDALDRQAHPERFCVVVRRGDGWFDIDASPEPTTAERRMRRQHPQWYAALDDVKARYATAHLQFVIAGSCMVASAAFTLLWLALAINLPTVWLLHVFTAAALTSLPITAVLFVHATREVNRLLAEWSDIIAVGPRTYIKQDR